MTVDEAMVKSANSLNDGKLCLPSERIGHAVLSISFVIWAIAQMIIEHLREEGN